MWGADAGVWYGNLGRRNAGFEVVPVPFAQRKEAGIENLARFLNHGRQRIADEGDLKVVIRQMLRLHRNGAGNVVKVDEWSRRGGHGGVFRGVYLNDGISRPAWDYDQNLVAVDRTYALDAAYEDIEAGRWWLMPGTVEIDDGEFFAQMKAPKRERDLSTGQLRFRWSESAALEHCRHAHAFDHLASFYVNSPVVFV